MGTLGSLLTKLEKEFQQQVTLYGKEIDEAFQKVKDLSEKYGIPFGSYIPKSFDKYRGHDDEDNECHWIEGVGPRFVDKLCAMDNEWLSSTVECEFNNVGY